MKAVFFGGGSFRLLGILRSAMVQRGLFDGGAIHLHDLDVPRAEAMGRMLAKTPEFARARPTITWGSALDRALEGADAVGVILMAGSRLSHSLGEEACIKHGFLGSDNVSPSGALLAVKGGPILMDLARRMERRCPQAWLIDFANPVAVMSAAVNNHTRIRALGVCQGFCNHQWDLARLLMGRDEQCPDFDVDVAGVNHLSFILRGTYRGKDLFRLLDRRLVPGWRPPRLGPQWQIWMRRNITRGLGTLARLYRDLGILIFSTEGDGMMHLNYDACLQRVLAEGPRPTRAAIAAGIRRGALERRKDDAFFRSHLAKDLDAAFWSGPATRDFMFQRQDEDIFVRVLAGIAGVRKVKIATSRPNRGAVAGFTDRTVLEYSQVLGRGAIRPVPGLAVPPVVQGLTSSLATHQTMLADAIATEDPKLLAQALQAYPVRAYSPALKALGRDLLAINAAEIPPALAKARQYL